MREESHSALSHPYTDVYVHHKVVANYIVPPVELPQVPAAQEPVYTLLNRLEPTGQPISLPDFLSPLPKSVVLSLWVT